jgi:hypothetical protein
MFPLLLHRRRVRFLAAFGALIVVSAVLAVSGARGAAGSTTVQGSNDLTGTVLVCSTDTVTLSGTDRFTENGFVKQLGDGTFLSHGSLSFDLSGVEGSGASGGSYQVVGATHDGFAFTFGSLSPGIDVEHTTETWQLVPIGGGRPLSFRENFVFVVTPSGSTILVDHGPSDCI